MFFKCGGAHFQRDCNARRRTGKQSSGKGKQSKAWSKSEGKGASKENERKSIGKSKGAKGAKLLHKGKKHRTLVYQAMKTRNQRQTRKLKNLHRRVPLTILGFMMAGVMMNGMMAGVTMSGMTTGVRLDGTKVSNKRMTIPQAHCHLEVLTSVP